MEIRQDTIEDARVEELLQEHLDDMHTHSPPESVHALDLAALRRPEITFWTMWDGDDLLGCGALKELDPTHGEVKSMRTSRSHLRKGVALKMLQHIIDEARSRGYRRLSLETGSMDAFLPARKLYENAGFTYCGPFGDYADDPYSVFLTAELASLPISERPAPSLS